MSIPEKSAGLILEYFKTASKKVFRHKELAAELTTNRTAWNLPEGVKTKALVELLARAGDLRLISLRSEVSRPPVKRYVWGQASPFEIALSLKMNSYFTHSTAVFLHGLTDLNPLTLYINVEQSRKPRQTIPPTQRSIDRAFSSSQRSSRNVYVHDPYRLVLLNGKNTDQYGVIALPPDERTRTTSLERTLVDITVRPAYGGGVHQVLATFRAASEKISVSRVIAALRSLDHVYPYHQAVGFYLEKAGFPRESLQRLKAMGLDFSFFLAYGLKDPAFDDSWKIFYPRNL